MNSKQIDINKVLVILMEECAELSHRCSKILRFGNNKKSEENLIEEIGDVLCLIDILMAQNKISLEEVNQRKLYKLKKLLNKGYISKGL